MQTKTNKRKPYDSDLTDEQWGAIADLATLPGAKTGRPRINQREGFNAVLYVLYTGCRWNDLPHDFGISDTSAYRYLVELKEKKRLSAIFERLKSVAEKRGKIKLHNAYVDAESSEV